MKFCIDDGTSTSQFIVAGVVRLSDHRATRVDL